MNKCLIILILTGFAVTTIVFAEDPPTLVWDATFDYYSFDDWGEDIVVDAAGFIYVTGNTYNGTDYDWLTIKYRPNGTGRWARTYNSFNDTVDVVDNALAIAVDNSGNVYVVGWTPDANKVPDWRYMKYDSTGTVLWNKTRDWAADVAQGAHSVVVDTAGGYLYMIGDFISSNGTWDYLCVKCDLDGNYVSENGWSGGTGVNNNAWAITIDTAGFVYVTGNVYNATLDWGTVKYDANLTLQWSSLYDSGFDEYIGVDAIAVDNSGNTYIGGWVGNATLDWQIVKYDANGDTVWTKTIDSGYDEELHDLVVDTAGFIYAHGGVYTGTNWDCRTMKFDPDGNVQWDVSYDGGSGYNDAGRGVAVDNAGFVYAVGHSYTGADHDFLTLKYEQQTGIEEQSSGGYFSLLSLEVVNNPTSAPIFCYTLPAGMKGTLSFYSVDGRRIEEFSLNSSQSTFTWNASKLPCGVYFARLGLGNQSISAKICLTK